MVAGTLLEVWITGTDHSNFPDVCASAVFSKYKNINLSLP